MIKEPKPPDRELMMCVTMPRHTDCLLLFAAVNAPLFSLLQSASPQLLSSGLTRNNRGGGSQGTGGSTGGEGGREGGGVLWAGLGTAQNHCPGSNPISPQTSKSSEEVSGRSAARSSEGSLSASPPSADLPPLPHTTYKHTHTTLSPLHPALETTLSL